MDKPEHVTDEHLEYLDELHESGETNMYGAGVYLQKEFEVKMKVARSILGYWMDTFSERHST